MFKGTTHGNAMHLHSRCMGWCELDFALLVNVSAFVSSSSACWAATAALRFASAASAIAAVVIASVLAFLAATWVFWQGLSAGNYPPAWLAALVGLPCCHRPRCRRLLILAQLPL